MRTERCIRLHLDLVGTAKLVEIVHIQRSEIDLQRLVNRRQRHTKLLGLGAVDVGKQLRHIDLIAGKYAGQFRCLPCLHLHRLHRLVQFVVTEIAAIFNHHLEAADCAESIDRWRRKYHDECIFDCTQFLVDLLRDRTARLLRRRALVKRIKTKKHDTRIRRISETID